MTNQINIDPSYKVIADHLRSCSFLIADGVLPSNEGRGYVLRRIMRRAMRHIHKLQTSNIAKKEQKNNQNIMYLLVPALIKEMGEAYPELIRAKDVIIETLKNEEEKFRETLEKGLKLLDEELREIANGRGDGMGGGFGMGIENAFNKENGLGALGFKFSGVIAFKLYDTYGFPLDLTQDILKEKGLEVNLQEFDTEMEKQKNRGRENWAGSGENKEDDLFLKLKEKFGETKFLGYETLQAKAKILAIIENGKEVEKIKLDDNRFKKTDKAWEITEASFDGEKGSAFIILDQTPFYATSGGQEGDSGRIICGDNYITISKTKKLAGNLFGHLVQGFSNTGISGEFKIGDEVIAKVNQKTRQAKANNHSATHLLHKALKEILGNSISQKGSDVDSDGFTFDFNFNRQMTSKEIESVENLVNEKICQNTEIKTQIMSLDLAKESGAEALFGEKYDKQVRVLSMGEAGENISQDILPNNILESEIAQKKQAWSVELCGGTHAKRTGDIGFFKIISESGIASGIRRIEAKTGESALSYLKEKQKKAEEIIREKEEQIKQKDKQIAVLKKQILLNNLENLKAENIAGISFYSHIFDNCEAKELREITSEIKNKKDFQTSSILAFFAIYNEKVALCISLSKDLVGKFDTNRLIAPAIVAIGGKGGGGKPDLAMGGGDNKNNISTAIDILKSLCL